MAPQSPPRTQVEDLPQDEFLAKLAEFHQERGTTLETQGRVNGKFIDLQNLYRLVILLGGYDKVSDQKLAWRKIAQDDFRLGPTNAAAYAFAVKTIYYKNLAAFEIKHHWHEDPPPKEILEDTTARGGNLRSRTVENFSQRQSTATEDEASGEEETTTPNGDKMNLDEPSSITGRSTRGLRQAPPQRVPYQPDVSSPRQTRTATGHLQSPQPHGVPSSTSAHPTISNTSIMPQSLANYEPKPPVPMTLRGVNTPANSMARFLQERAQANQNAASRREPAKPGSGYDGPNIYVRCLCALRSGLREEQHYALHHLVKISHERGDKFKFEAFPNLAEGLIEYILSICLRYWPVNWRFDYQGNQTGVDILNGVDGTLDLQERIGSFARIDTEDELEPEDVATHFIKAKEAALTLRNLALMDDNALYLSGMTEIRDMLTIILSLPQDHRLVELKIYILDVAECVIRHWIMAPDDPLYRLLLEGVGRSSDRAIILTSLRAICRISMNLAESNLLRSVPLSVVENVYMWLLLPEDEELVSASLDFLYQYSAVPSNVAVLVYHSKSKNFPLYAVMSRLKSLLHHGEIEVRSKILLQAAVIPEAPKDIPKVPADLMEQLRNVDEPERSNTWMKCVFEEEPESEITQIALWHAYQNVFIPISNGAIPGAPSLLPAAEFIKNVSQIFPGANAQVVNTDQSKFIIKGIRPRRLPVDPQGQPYLICRWQAPGEPKYCGDFLGSPPKLFTHLLGTHIGVSQSEGGGFDSANATDIVDDLDCYWNGCLRFSRTDSNSMPRTKQALAKHLRQHIPSSNSRAIPHYDTARHFLPNKLGPGNTHDPLIPPAMTPELEHWGCEALHHDWTYYDTPVDERGHAAGIPLSAALILRNLARNIPKAVDLFKSGGVDVGPLSRADLASGDHLRSSADWMDQIFHPVKDELFWALTYNRSLMEYAVDILELYERGIAA